MIKIHILFVKSQIKQQLIPFCYINKKQTDKKSQQKQPYIKANL